MSEKSVVLLLESAASGALEQTRSELERKGLVVDKVMPLMRTITGRIDDEKMTELQRVKNVKLVREERSFQLPPMDEGVPQ